MRQVIFVLSGIALVVFTSAVMAAPTLIVDTTIGTAFNDGTVGAGEYVGFSTGINGGFGDVIGANSELHIDSSLAGGLNFGLKSGGGGMNDAIVIYIDSVPGGFADTTTINDNADAGRGAISGNGTAGGASEITFAPGFEADYAITMEAGFSSLFQLAAGGPTSLNWLRSNNITPTGNAGAGQWEIDLTLGDIGLSPGGSFDYVVTYLSGVSAWRSDEFHGVAQSTVPGGNIEQNPIALAAGDYNTFVSIPEPHVLSLVGIGCALVFARRRR